MARKRGSSKTGEFCRLESNAICRFLSFVRETQIGVVHFPDIYNFKIFLFETGYISIFEQLQFFTFDKYVIHQEGNRDWNARCLKMFSIFSIAANLITENKEGDFYNIEIASRMEREFSFTENALNDALTFIFPFGRVAAHSATLKKEITNFLLLAACLLTASMAIYQHCSSFRRINGTVIRFFHP